MRHIGILAHSANGAALCFLEMVREAARRLGAHQHPEITLSILPMGPALEQCHQPLPLPGLHIAEVVAEQAKADGRTYVGLLGTKWTMEGPVYPAAFARHGLTMRTPAPADRGLVDDVIFGELCQGRVVDSSRAEYVRIIDGLQREGCDAVALSCTEIPLLITPDVSPLRTLDSTRLLAQAAVATALGERTAQWHGGPVERVEDNQTPAAR